MTTIDQLFEEGQSVWYDNIHRSLLTSGELKGMIERGDIRGVTSNPTIFMNAITKSSDYDDQLNSLAKAGKTAEDIFWALAVSDIQNAADQFADLYRESDGGDGYVSLEVNPLLANDTAGTVADVARFWKMVDRPNLMIKIPATPAGIPAIAASIEAGYNINITLIFGRERYAEVMDAYLTGLEKRVAAGKPIDRIASVASFFVSRVDSLLDPRLEAHQLDELAGKIAIANAKMAFQDFKEVFTSERYNALAAQGARRQRPLWASTSTKNPKYRDVMYVEELIGPETVNTIPPQTLQAFLEHGVVRLSLEEEVNEAAEALRNLEENGVSLLEATNQLEAEGVASFAKSYHTLLQAVGEKVGA